MAIDSHSHIYGEEFQEDFNEVIERLKENNVNKVMIVGFSHETNEQVVKLHKEYPNLYPTAGIHPDQVKFTTEKDIEILEKFIQENRVYAIGECGLDYHWEPETKEAQKWLFEAQIQLSIKYNLPLIIHSRDASQDTYDLLEKYKGKIRFVMHCYSGSVEMAKRYLELGGMISLGGPVTFKNAVESKEVAKMVPLDRLMIETDSPYMAPVPMRGKRNESAFVRYVLLAIAELRGLDPTELEAQLDKNTINFFNLD